MKQTGDMGSDSDKTAIAVINTNVTYIQKDISDIKQVLKDGYATKDSLTEVAKQVEKRLTALEVSNGLWKWLTPVTIGFLSSIFSSVVTFLVISYLQTKK